ncbi:MAG: hypothetical protein K9K79_13035 [Desulfohalobiaceae bacterium]|nr:hypothetical protein [Desulfohalobiaceae bacterium]
MNFLGDQQWLIIALVFFGIIAYIAWIRWRDRQWINRRFAPETIKAMSFGVNYFGLVSEPGSPRRSSGFLILLKDRLFYRSRLKKLELEIPGSAIFHVDHDRGHKGVNLHQSVVRVFFVNNSQEKDCAAFKLPYPPQWIKAIENSFLANTDRGASV